VQSVAVKLIVEREREIQAFEANSFFKVVGTFLSQEQKTFTAELNKQLKSEAETMKFLELLQGANYAIKDIEVKP
jgi:DNA topoisomerase